MSPMSEEFCEDMYYTKYSIMQKKMLTEFQGKNQKS